MAEGRIVSRRISRSEKIASLSSDTARMFYTWIIPYSDVEGRMEADHKLLKADICPLLDNISPKDISDILQELHNVGLIILYKHEDRSFIQITKFEDNQPNLRKDREASSKIPPPPTKRKCWTKEIKERVWAVFYQSNHKCPVCKRQGIEKVNNIYLINGYIPFEIDHIVPLASGGTDDESNLQVICRTCNRSKCNSGPYPEQLQTLSGPSPAKEKRRERKRIEYSDDFLSFWSTYPKKSGNKKKAWLEWEKLDLPPLKTIIDAIVKQDKWRRHANGEFRPEWKDPERWIKYECWNDEVETKAQGSW